MSDLVGIYRYLGHPIVKLCRVYTIISLLFTDEKSKAKRLGNLMNVKQLVSAGVRIHNSGTRVRLLTIIGSPLFLGKSSTVDTEET